MADPQRGILPSCFPPHRHRPPPRFFPRFVRAAPRRSSSPWRRPPRSPRPCRLQPQQAPLLSPPCSPLALALSRPIRTRQPHRRRNRPPPRRLDSPGCGRTQISTKRRGALHPGGASLLYAPGAENYPRADWTLPRHPAPFRRIAPALAKPTCRQSKKCWWMWDRHTTRNPILLFRFCG